MKETMIAAFVAAVAVAVASPSAAQTCTWGGTSSLAEPSATPLRSYRDFFHSPARVAVDRLGNVYVTDPGGGGVFVRDGYGRLMAVIPGFGSPLGIAVDARRRIYVGDQATGDVTVFDEHWNALFKLGRGPGEFQMPNDIAIHPQTGRVYVSDSAGNTVRYYAPDGGFLGSFGDKGAGAGYFDFPAGIHVSVFGEVFVADQNNDRVQVFDADGKFLRCFGGRGGAMAFTKRFGRIQGISGDSLGRVYVADAFQGWVQVFDARGALLGTVGSFGEGGGQLRTPMGLALDRYNRLIVASANNARVEVFGLDAYSDPRVIPAVVDVEPDTLNRSSERKWITAYIEMRGYPLDQVDPASITANGVPARPRPVTIGDHDEDLIPDLMVKFDAASVLATLADGEAAIVVTGEFGDGATFEGYASVRVMRHGREPREAEPGERESEAGRRPGADE